MYKSWLLTRILPIDPRRHDMLEGRRCFNLSRSDVFIPFLTANILFAISVFTMVVVSLFTKEIPRDELGGLTWPTINEPPLAHGAIGEDVEALEKLTTMQMEGTLIYFLCFAETLNMTISWP